MRKGIEEKFLKLNPKIRREDLNWRADGRLEWICRHRTGHTVFSPINDKAYYDHGCDGCCEKIKTLYKEK